MELSISLYLLEFVPFLIERSIRWLWVVWSYLICLQVIYLVLLRVCLLYYGSAFYIWLTLLFIKVSITNIQIKANFFLLFDLFIILIFISILCKL